MESYSDQEMRRELERMTMAIERYSEQLERLDGQIVVIQEECQNDDVNRQIKEYESAMAQKSTGDIAAEDALDNIVRLQNQLKIVRRRNQLLTRENAVQRKFFTDRANLLKKTSDELEKVCEVTGWNGQAEDADFDEITAYHSDAREMQMRELETIQELRSMKVIIKKKEDTILKLSQQVDGLKDRQIFLNKLNNDIRVKQRDTREQQAKLQRMNADDSGIDRALVEVKDKDNAIANSLYNMENDKEFLTEAVAETRLICRRQDNVVKAQLARQQQLQKRIEAVTKSLREMKLEKEFERNVAKSALVPSASRDEPEDVFQILPEDEHIPIDTYRLLYKNNEMMRTNVARKNMLVLEKESVMQAMDAKLRSYVEMHNMNAREDDDLRMGKNVQVNELMLDLRQEHEDYRSEIDELEHENARLRAELMRRTTALRRAQINANAKRAAKKR